MAFLDPNGDVSNNWTITGAATASLALDDAIRNPTVPGTTDNVSTSTVGNICNINVADYTLGIGEVVSSAVVNIYLNTGTKRGVTIDLLDDSNTVIATATLGAGLAANWQTITYTGALTQSQINGLKVRLTCTSTGGGGATAVTVQEVYVNLQTSVPQNYTESSIINPVTSVSTVESTGYVDPLIVITVSQISDIELVNYTEGSEVNTLTTINSSESYISGAPKQTDIYRTKLSTGLNPNVSTPQTIKIEASKANVADSGILRIWLYQGLTLIEGPYDVTLTDIFVTYSHDLVNYASISDWSDIEIAIQGIADVGADLTPNVSRIEFDIPAAGAQIYTESAIIKTSTTTIISDDANYVDSSELDTLSLVSGVDVSTYIEFAVIQTTSSIQTTDFANFVDQIAITGILSVSSSELFILAQEDTAQIGTITSLQLTEVAAFVDQNSTNVVTSILSSEQKVIQDISIVITSSVPVYSEGANFIDSSSLNSITLISSIEQHFIPDLAEIKTNTNISTSELVNYADSLAINTVASILTLDQASYVDSSETDVVTSISSIEEHINSYIDNAEIDFISLVASSEFQGSGAQDSATVSTATDINYLEQSIYADLLTPTTISTPITIDISDYVDSSTITGMTIISAQELYSQTYFDVSEIDFYTYIVSEEFQRIIIANFAGVLQLKWAAVKFAPRWVASIFTARASIFGRKNEANLVGQTWEKEWTH